MLYLRDDTLLTSDWHVLHRNIYWFLPCQRQRISGVSDVERLSPEDFLAAERRTYERVSDHIRDVVGARPIRRLVFLGDFVFGLGRGHRTRELLDTLERDVPAVLEIFEFLRTRGVARLLVMGNHDDFRRRDKQACAFYQRLFDDVSFFVRERDVLYTHFPLGYSRVADATRGSADEKYYRMNKAFHRLDRRLLDELGGSATLNFHGHIHAGVFTHAVDGVTHRNVALDVVAGNPGTDGPDAMPGARRFDASG